MSECECGNKNPRISYGTTCENCDMPPAKFGEISVYCTENMHHSCDVQSDWLCSCLCHINMDMVKKNRPTSKYIDMMCNKYPNEKKNIIEQCAKNYINLRFVDHDGQKLNTIKSRIIEYCRKNLIHVDWDTIKPYKNNSKLLQMSTLCTWKELASIFNAGSDFVEFTEHKCIKNSEDQES